MTLSVRMTCGSLLALCWLAVACNNAKKIDVGGTCTLNSDCNSPLVCTMGKCHAGCVETRDCPLGQSCMMSNGVGVCQLATEAACTSNADCADTRWVCASDLRCRTQCASSDDCSQSQLCVRNVCADGQDLDVSTGQLPQKQPQPDAGGGPDTASSLAPARLTATPQSLPFGSVPQGQTSKEFVVTLLNAGQEPSGVISFGPDNPEFVIVGGGNNDCTNHATNLSGNESCTVRLTLTPAGTGARNGKLSFSSPAGGGGEVGLSGTGACPVDTIDDGSGKCVPMAGVVWEQRGQSLAWWSVASSADGTRLVAAGNGTNIYISSDSGLTWISQESARSWGAVASSANGSRLLAGCYMTGDLFLSNDFGETWKAAGRKNEWRAVAMSADGLRLFAAAGGPGAPTDELIISSDGGTTWETSPKNFGIPSGISASADGTRILLNTGRTWLSTDSGRDWSEVALGQYWSGVAVSRDGSLLMGAKSGNGGYLYLSRDDGASWSETGSSQSYSRIAGSADGKRLLASTGGGYLYHSIDGGKTWTQRASARSWMGVASSDDGTKLVAVANGGYIYTSSGPLP